MGDKKRPTHLHEKMRVEPSTQCVDKVALVKEETDARELMPPFDPTSRRAVALRDGAGRKSVDELREERRRSAKAERGFSQGSSAKSEGGSTH
jgi:hypothetical protein